MILNKPFQSLHSFNRTFKELKFKFRGNFYFWNLNLLIAPLRNWNKVVTQLNNESFKTFNRTFKELKSGKSEG